MPVFKSRADVGRWSIENFILQPAQFLFRTNIYDFSMVDTVFFFELFDYILAMWLKSMYFCLFVSQSQSFNKSIKSRRKKRKNQRHQKIMNTFPDWHQRTDFRRVHFKENTWDCALAAMYILCLCLTRVPLWHSRRDSFPFVISLISQCPKSPKLATSYRAAQKLNWHQLKQTLT